LNFCLFPSCFFPSSYIWPPFSFFHCPSDDIYLNSGFGNWYIAVMSQFTLQCKLELVADTSRKTVVSSNEEKVRQLLMSAPKYCDSWKHQHDFWVTVTDALKLIVFLLFVFLEWSSLTNFTYHLLHFLLIWK
jgi:hypothetical protein